MNIQKIQNENPNIKQQQFKGAIDTTLLYLATNQAVGANVVDVCSMVAPRTISDFTRRGPNAGAETLRRESMGTINDSSFGLYGALAGSTAAGLIGMEKKFGSDIEKLNSNQILAAPETLDILAEFKNNQIHKNETQIDYLKNVLKNLKAFNPQKTTAEDGFLSLSDETVEKIAKMIDDALNTSQSNAEKKANGQYSGKLGFKNWADKKGANSIKTVMNLITEETGAQSKYILESADKSIKSESTLETVLEDIFKLSNAFNKPKVKEAFEKNLDLKNNPFIVDMKKFMKAKSYAGFAMASAVGISVQPINMYLTKMKTGQDGFVGVEGRSKDDSKGFLALRIGTAIAGFGGILASLGCGLKDFMSKMAFKGFWPTINQLKGVYGITIISRIVSTRDKDELRETVTKDSLGYVSWLILGDIINRMTAEGLDNSVLNRTKEVEGKKFFGRTFGSKLKSRNEVLIDTLATNGIKTVKEDGVAKTFSEMLKEAEAKLPETAKKVVKKKLRTLNIAQGSGYLFSGLVLGLGIPNLNIYITNRLDKKRKAEAAEKAANTQQAD